MVKPKEIVLSWLLHHANRYEKDKHFYDIKSKVLKKYGAFTGYDVQFIEGKKCHTCCGTGVYHGYGYHGSFKDICNRCWGGWYKRPEWNILEVYRFGKYKFHIPFKKVFKAPEQPVNIEWYVYHKASYWSHFSRIAIFLLFDPKGWRKNWHTELGRGWRSRMFYSPKNFINNVMHLILKRGKSWPVYRLKQRWRNLFPKPVKPTVVSHNYDDDDLPF